MNISQLINREIIDFLWLLYIQTNISQLINREDADSLFIQKNISQLINREDADSLGAIHSTKISGNFGLKLNGSVRSNRKSFEKSGPPFEVDLFSRLERSDRNGPFHDHSDPFSIPGPRCSISSVYKMEENTHHCTFMDC